MNRLDQLDRYADTEGIVGYPEETCVLTASCH